MGSAVTRGTAVKTDSVTSVLNAAADLAKVVGPGWGFAFVVAVCLLLPRFGVLSYLAKLWKEDRADSRKQKIESERLVGRYRNRPQPAPGSKVGSGKIPKGKEG